MEKKEIEAKKVNCPSCGAVMKYVPEKQKLYCENCETCKDIEFKAITEKRLWADRNKGTKSTKEWAKETKNLKCKNCGASVVLNKLEYSKKCPYCESALIGENEELKSLTPDGIIPFKLSAMEASNKYVQGVKKKFFVPRAFKKAPPVENIKGIYIPSFSFDAKSNSTYKGTLADDDSYTDRNGNKRTKTTYKNISGTHQSDNKDVIVESSSKLNQVQLTQILPYDMKQMVEFKQGFIMGYVVEQYETTVEECEKISKRIMEENIKRTILSKYHYDRVISFDMATQYTEEKYMYYLLPIYKCAFTYKKKEYTTFMNGQTGKVGGGFPISVWKVLFVVFGFVLFFLGIIALVMFI